MKYITIPTLAILIVIFQNLFVNAKIERSCQNTSGDPVDWYVIFLFPKVATSDKAINYGYFDDTMKEIQNYTYEDDTFPANSAFSNYNDGKSNYFLWNDEINSSETESKTSSSKAHSKGALMFDVNSGLLLSHSLPKYPDRDQSDKIITALSSNAGHYGQTFLCISTDLENSLKIVETLNIIDPLLMLNVEKDLTGKNNAAVEKLIKGTRDSKSENEKITAIKSRGGQDFDIFSKSRKSPNLPYDTSIPQEYKSGFYVETWTRPALLPSDFESQYQIINVQSMNYGGYSFNHNQEHSKWAVSIEKDICCFGDLNRTESQKKRGGNVICFRHETLSKLMRNAITDVDRPNSRLQFLS